jgi:hypothetical protein
MNPDGRSVSFSQVTQQPGWKFRVALLKDQKQEIRLINERGLIMTNGSY